MELCDSVTLQLSFEVHVSYFELTLLEAMKKAGVPLNAGKIVELTCLERKEVDKAMTTLKAEGAIVSPSRCYWQPE